MFLFFLPLQQRLQRPLNVPLLVRRLVTAFVPLQYLAEPRGITQKTFTLH